MVTDILVGIRTLVATIVVGLSSDVRYDGIAVSIDIIWLCELATLPNEFAVFVDDCIGNGQVNCIVASYQATLNLLVMFSECDCSSDINDRWHWHESSSNVRQLSLKHLNDTPIFERYLLAEAERETTTTTFRMTVVAWLRQRLKIGSLACRFG